MSSIINCENSKINSFSGSVRGNYFELWNDFLTYGENLNANWMVSQEIFRRNILPTAENDPILFARWVNKMVKVSGLEVKSRNVYAHSLRVLRKFKQLKRNKKQKLSKALTELLNAGLNEALYAKKALNSATK